MPVGQVALSAAQKQEYEALLDDIVTVDGGSD